MCSISLLLTATVSPIEGVISSRPDPLVRERDYATALRFWIRSGLRNIVFCENSGWPLDQIRRIGHADGVRVEALGFVDAGATGSLGKGYGEMGIIEYAIGQSKSLAASAYILKVTGRYMVLNIAQMLSDHRLRRHPTVVADMNRHRRYADSRVFLATPAFMTKYLLVRRNQVNDQAGFYFEHALASAINASENDGHKWLLPNVLPEIRGISGSIPGEHRVTLRKRLGFAVKKIYFAR